MTVTVWTAVWVGATVLGAGVIRGYSGFGFSMITVVVLSSILAPSQIVPVILMLEVAASAWLLPRVWRHIHWASLSWLSLGVAIGTPLGIYLLASIPPREMRIAIGVVVLLLGACMWRGFRFQRMPNRVQTAMAGVASGVLNGGTSMGGPPVILFYLSGPAGAAVSRASMIAFFLGTDIFAFGVAMAHGLTTPQTWMLVAIALVPLWTGIGLGSRFFNPEKTETYRRRTIVLLMALALLALLRSLWG